MKSTRWLEISIPLLPEAERKYLARFDAHLAAGRWLFAKFARQSKESSVFSAARNCRKQGMPLETALILLRALP